MKKTIFGVFIVALILSACRTPMDVDKKIGSGLYMGLAKNIETNTMDTLYTTLNTDHTFIIRRTGERNKVVLAGGWQQKGRWITMTNRYPYEKPISVRVLPYTDSCNGYFPDLMDSTGKVADRFYFKVHGMPYFNGDIIPYAELDTSGKVRVSSTGGNHRSDWFTIPYKDCYRIIVDMEFNPDDYNGAIRKMYLRKRKNKLELMKSESSGNLRY